MHNKLNIFYILGKLSSIFCNMLKIIQIYRYLYAIIKKGENYLNLNEMENTNVYLLRMILV